MPDCRETVASLTRPSKCFRRRSWIVNYLSAAIFKNLRKCLTNSRMQGFFRRVPDRSFFTQPSSYNMDIASCFHRRTFSCRQRMECDRFFSQETSWKLNKHKTNKTKQTRRTSFDCSQLAMSDMRNYDVCIKFKLFYELPSSSSPFVITHLL